MDSTIHRHKIHCKNGINSKHNEHKLSKKNITKEL